MFYIIGFIIGIVIEAIKIIIGLYGSFEDGFIKAQDLLMKLRSDKCKANQISKSDKKFKTVFKIVFGLPTNDPKKYNDNKNSIINKLKNIF